MVVGDVVVLVVAWSIGALIVVVVAVVAVAGNRVRITRLVVVVGIVHDCLGKYSNTNTNNNCRMEENTVLCFIPIIKKRQAFRNLCGNPLPRATFVKSPLRRRDRMRMRRWDGSSHAGNGVMVSEGPSFLVIFMEIVKQEIGTL